MNQAREAGTTFLKQNLDKKVYVCVVDTVRELERVGVERGREKMERRRSLVQFNSCSSFPSPVLI